MKRNIGKLSMNNTYDFMGITDAGEANFSACYNCSRPIRYICELKDQSGKTYFVGTECTKTLTQARINNEYSMNEQIKEFKKIAAARNLIEKSDNCKFWGYDDRSALVVVGKSGKAPKKIYIEPIYDPFLNKNYGFIDSFINEVYDKYNVITRNYASIDYFEYFDSLKI